MLPTPASACPRRRRNPLPSRPISACFCANTAEILSVSQHEFERIVEIRLRCTGDFSRCERVLVCEIMGKYSNLVLTENGTILGALKTTSLEDNAKRVLLSGAKYVYPLPQDKLSPFDAEGLKARTEAFRAAHERSGREEFAKFLFENVAGLALPTARELLNKYSHDRPVWEFVGEFCASYPSSPCLKRENGFPTDFFAFPVEGGIPMPSLNEAEDAYYSAKEGRRAFEDKKRKLESAVRGLLKKQRKKLQDTLERLDACSDMEKERVKGELLTANLWRIEKGMKELEAENWYSPDGGTIKIALDERLSPSQNAQRYFKAYQKQKRTLDALLPRRKTEEEEISYSESVLSSLAAAETQDDLKETETELVSLGLVKPQRERDRRPLPRIRIYGLPHLRREKQPAKRQAAEKLFPFRYLAPRAKIPFLARHRRGGGEKGPRRSPLIRRGNLRLLFGRAFGRQGARGLLRTQTRKKAPQIQGGLRRLRQL